MSTQKKEPTMLGKLFLLFAVIPVIEIYVLVSVGSVIGSLNTVALVLLSAFVGAWLARQQGLSTMLRVRASLQQGIMPAEEILDAVLIFVAGAVLLTPGFVTDALGLLILFPPTRIRFKTWLRRKFDEWMKNPNVHIHYRNF
jgi:UPF0716 protein FxsA